MPLDFPKTVQSARGSSSMPRQWIVFRNCFFKTLIICSDDVLLLFTLHCKPIVKPLANRQNANGAKCPSLNLEDEEIFLCLVFFAIKVHRSTFQNAQAELQGVSRTETAELLIRRPPPQASLIIYAFI